MPRPRCFQVSALAGLAPTPSEYHLDHPGRLHGVSVPSRHWHDSACVVSRWLPMRVARQSTFGHTAHDGRFVSLDARRSQATVWRFRGAEVPCCLAFTIPKAALAFSALLHQRRKGTQHAGHFSVLLNRQKSKKKIAFLVVQTSCFPALIQAVPPLEAIYGSILTPIQILGGASRT